MTQQERNNIVEGLRAYVAKYPSQNKAAASLNGISAGTLSAILNGKHEAISEEMWRNIASQIVMPSVSSEWQFVETHAYQEIVYALKDAQEFKGVRWITGDAGCGKTTTARLYTAENREAFTVLCDKDMRKGDFIREMARKVGFKYTGMRLRDILDTVIERLMRMENPLLIFDEGDKLKNEVFYLFINIYNRLEDKCGIVFMSTSYIQRRMARGTNGAKEGYDEIFSRIGKKFFELEPTSAVDVAAICQANGLNDRRQIDRIIEEADEKSFDLRCVKTAIHREKRQAQARIKKQRSTAG